MYQIPYGLKQENHKYSVSLLLLLLRNITFKEQILLWGIEIIQYTYTWFAITMKQAPLKILKSSPQRDEVQALYLVQMLD